MGRYSKNKSYRHHCSAFTTWTDTYMISWTVDRYYQSSRLRFPISIRRVTDERGARRFCQKHGIEFPKSAAASERHDEQEQGE